MSDKLSNRERKQQYWQKRGNRFQKNDPTKGPTASYGVRGLKTMGGRIYEEYLTALKSWDRESKVYLEMRDDVTIGTLLDACKLPLLAAPFTVEPPASGTAIDQAAADWLQDSMNRMDRQTWKAHVEDCLDALDFGFSVGEIVLEKRADGRMWLKNIDPRGQETLDHWEFDAEVRDKVTEFVQRDPDYGTMIPIPLQKCIHVTFRGRKGNPQGRSLLRSLYRPWRFCKDLENLEGIGIERDVGSMPIAKLPADGDVTTEDKTLLENGLKGMRMDENSYLIAPPGVDITPYGGGQKAYDVGAVIERKQKEILGRMFAQFLKLGMDKVGTQALVQGSQDFFDLALISIQEYLVSAWNQQLVPYLFSFNYFPGMTDYPLINWQKPGKVDVKSIIEALNTAAGAKLFTPTDVDEDHLRTLMDWPELPEEERGMDRSPEAPAMPGIFTPKESQSLRDILRKQRV